MLDEDAVIGKDYIEKYSQRAEKEISVSNDIIVHDLIKKTTESDEVINGGSEWKRKRGWVFERLRFSSCC